ncbi:hypothetical protein [Streptomyces boluensis]|uniref:Uncharacterized protein n=1 Tax=Streptomyces boluensis TaxID=1775135 RepID=A0A964UWU0_9ACTN|nr:hypothetical protein [Streptomyces boluensis]NBE56913.1 hypothetical protein [Streptomyces boluensis]
MGLHEAQLLVAERFRQLGARVARTPESPLDVDSLAARAADCPGRVVEVVAEWDGDTVHDWFVDLLVRTADPAGEHRLATVYRHLATRHLGAEATPGAAGASHPSAVVAERCGTALAARLSVPFRFAVW